LREAVNNVLGICAWNTHAGVCSNRKSALPPLVRGIPFIGDTFQYLKLGPYFGVPHHEKHGRIYRFDLYFFILMFAPSACINFWEHHQHETQAVLLFRSYLLGEQVIHVGDADACRRLLTSEHKLVESKRASHTSA